MPGAGASLAFAASGPNSTLDSLGQVWDLAEFLRFQRRKDFETTHGERLDKVGIVAYRTRSRAQIAQLVEQRIENPRVAGSIPALGTIFSSNDFIELRRNRGFARCVDFCSGWYLGCRLHVIY
jgi:hypothetical protein